MATQTTICNLALGLLGSTTILSVEDATPSARACKRFYDQTLDEVIQAHQWSFATRRAVLSQLADEPLFGWAFQYQLPYDQLRIIELNQRDCWDDGSIFAIEGDRLLTNDGEAKVRYLHRVTDANLFPALFIEALANKLAAKLAKPLTNSETLANGFLTEFEKITGPRAKRADAVEGKLPVDRPWDRTTLVQARYGG